MKKNILTFFSLLTVIAVISAGLLPASAQTSMKDVLGVDFGEDFAIVVDFNGFNSVDNFQVLDDLVNGNSNLEVDSSDNVASSDQEFFLSHFNASGVHNSYFALDKVEFDMLFNTPYGGFNLGHVNASAPFQTLLQYYSSGDADVFVANTFRGYMAYSTNSTDPTLDTQDDIYVGYTLVESRFLSLLNNTIINHGFTEGIPEYGYEQIYESTPTTKTFGMNYTNFFVVWQDTESQLQLPAINTDSFKGIVTGKDIVAASLFDYLTFTYKTVVVEANATHTVVDVITEYDVGPMKWLITTDDGAKYTEIDTAIPEIDGSNSFNTLATNVVIDLSVYNGLLPTVQVPIPSLSFYTGEAVNKRIDAAAVEGMATGFGISIVTSTNVYHATATLTLPGASTNEQNIEIPLSFGGDTVFVTSFNGKSTYDRTFTNGTTETDLDVYITTRSLAELTALIDVDTLVKPYFDAQSAMTEVFTIFTAKQLSPVVVASSSDDINMDVSSTEYVTFVQMPKWSGLEVTQDPTYTAVSLVSTGDGGSETSTSSGIDTSKTSTPTSIPGFEIVALIFAVVPLYIIKRKK